VILNFFVRYKHAISMVNYAKPNQNVDVVRYNREFAITVIVIIELDCTFSPLEFMIFNRISASKTLMHC
jgi:hypothetical protein